MRLKTYVLTSFTACEQIVITLTELWRCQATVARFLTEFGILCTEVRGRQCIVAGYTSYHWVLRLDKTHIPAEARYQLGGLFKLT